MASLYGFEGGLYLPGPMTVGPWSPDAQHGGPVAALLARAVESAVDVEAMQVVRLTVELLKPVPLEPLALDVSVPRPGRRVQLVEAGMVVAGTATVVAMARALCIRREAMSLPLDRSGPPVPPPAAAAPSASSEAAPSGGASSGGAPPLWPPRTAFAEALELRFVHGSWDELGPVTVWTRLVASVVGDEEPSPLQRAAAAADFGNGISRVVDFETHVFINPDLTVAFSRVPDGEWIGLDSVSRLSGLGFGQAESQIFDATGPCGRAIQSLIVLER